MCFFFSTRNPYGLDFDFKTTSLAVSTVGTSFSFLAPILLFLPDSLLQRIKKYLILAPLKYEIDGFFDCCKSSQRILCDLLGEILHGLRPHACLKHLSLKFLNYRSEDWPPYVGQSTPPSRRHSLPPMLLLDCCPLLYLSLQLCFCRSPWNLHTSFPVSSSDSSRLDGRNTHRRSKFH